MIFLIVFYYKILLIKKILYDAIINLIINCHVNYTIVICYE